MAPGGQDSFQSRFPIVSHRPPTTHAPPPSHRICAAPPTGSPAYHSPPTIHAPPPPYLRSTAHTLSSLPRSMKSMCRNMKPSRVRPRSDTPPGILLRTTYRYMKGGTTLRHTARPLAAHHLQVHEGGEGGGGGQGHAQTHRQAPCCAPPTSVPGGGGGPHAQLLSESGILMHTTCSQPADRCGGEPTYQKNSLPPKGI